jgi:hypothetical protein
LLFEACEVAAVVLEGGGVVVVDAAALPPKISSKAQGKRVLAVISA